MKEFSGTKGSFTGFRKRTGLPSVARHDEAARAAEKHREKFKKINEEGGFVSQLVFNCDETGLFWKRMPPITHITEETTLPGHKPMKDRLTLLFCATASGTIRSNHCSCTIQRTP